jgi:hypothetical protein
LREYHAKHGHFPPSYIAGDDGRPWHSWRVLILPYIGEEALFKLYRFDEPWDGPNNSRLLALRPAYFGCHSARGKEDPRNTNYVAVTGPGTVFPSGSWTTDKQIHDGCESTVWLIEASELDIKWTEPRDVTIGAPRENAAASRAIRSRDYRGAGVVMVSGDVWRARRGLLPETFHALATIAGGERIDLKKVFHAWLEE